MPGGGRRINSLVGSRGVLTGLAWSSTCCVHCTCLPLRPAPDHRQGHCLVWPHAWPANRTRRIRPDGRPPSSASGPRSPDPSHARRSRPWCQRRAPAGRPGGWHRQHLSDGNSTLAPAPSTADPRQAALTRQSRSRLSDIWIGRLPTVPPGRAAAFRLLPQLAVITQFRERLLVERMPACDSTATF
jgi:hypothetical protein